MEVIKTVLRGFRRVHFGNPRAHNDLQENLACGRSVLRCYRSAFGIKLSHMRFERIWIQQCKATRAIRRRFGVKSALDYLVGEKLVLFAQEAERRPEFAKEFPRFLAAVWQAFNQYELAGYVALQKPSVRSQLRRLLYLR